MDIAQRLLGYNDRLACRALKDIDLVVIHATELPDLDLARQFGERIHYAQSGTGNSGHYYIDRDGRIEQWVELDRIAHHVVGYNPRSIGIELVNLGRYPDWLNSHHQHWQENISPPQLDALLALLRQLEHTLPELRFVAGHDWLDQRFVPASNDASQQVRRKLDPGPDFPWDQLLEACTLLPLRRPQGG